MTVGYATDLDVDLSLTFADGVDCMIEECGNEAAWLGIINTPCGCDQELCVPHKDREAPKWSPGDRCWCYKCPKSEENGGKFVRWERLKR